MSISDMDEQLYSIEVTADIAAKIRHMEETGVFRMRNGSCELHFDPEGNLSQVVTHTFQKIGKLSTASLAPHKE